MRTRLVLLGPPILVNLFLVVITALASGPAVLIATVPTAIVVTAFLVYAVRRASQPHTPDVVITRDALTKSRALPSGLRESSDSAHQPEHGAEAPAALILGRRPAALQRRELRLLAPTLRL
jgi:hypothetical protein